MAAQLVHTRSSVLGLYHRMMRTAQRWPFDESRQGRTVKESMIATIRKEFKDNKNVSNDKINFLVRKGEQELEGLSDLLNETHRKMVHNSFSFNLIMIKVHTPRNRIPYTTRERKEIFVYRISTQKSIQELINNSIRNLFVMIILAFYRF